MLGTPPGSIIGSHVPRIVLPGMARVLDTVSLVRAYVILPLSLAIGLVFRGINIGNVGFFGFLVHMGFLLQNQLENLVR